MTEILLKKKNSRKPLNVMFGDFCYYNRQTIYSRYTPLGIGMIAQYAKEQLGNDIDVSLYKNIDKFFEKAAENPPDVVGFAVYSWNTAITKYATDQLKKMFGNKVIIILGGPSIDSDKNEQFRFMKKTFPNSDFLIVNEGELGFCNILKKILGNLKTLYEDPIDGAIFLKDDQVIQGKPVGLTLDLSTMGSPYLSGLMDEFMNSDYQPLIQTSRFCPYTCAFCVSGKNRGKLRGYPIEQVKEELEYVSKKYADRPHHTMYLADENFGILKRDIEIAEAIKKCKTDFGYPQSVFFYNDKRFTDTSRKVLEILRDLTQFGVMLALQTEDPAALKAINRRNVTNEEIDDAITWAKGIGLDVTTELIFGLPYETRESFDNILNRSIKRGFDNIMVQNLLLLDGIEMNRPDFRKKFDIKTKYRPLTTHYAKHKGNFFAEHEEVVVSTDSFSYEDFLAIRGLSFMYYAVFNQNFQRWFFHFIRHIGVSLSEFFSLFIKPDRNLRKWPKKYLDFLDDFKKAVEGELHDTPEEVTAEARKVFEENNNDVGESSRINVNFGSRLNYLENNWVNEVMMQHLNTIMGSKLSDENRNTANSLISLAERERVDLRKIGIKEPLNLSFDVINWKKNKFKDSPQSLKMPKKQLRFTVDKTQASIISGFQERFASYTDKDFYNAAMEFIKPRKFLLHSLVYEDSQQRVL